MASRQRHIARQNGPRLHVNDLVQGDAMVNAERASKLFTGLKGLVSRNELYVKLAILFVLLQVLLVALGMISGLIAERKDRQESVAREVSAAWGQEQVIAGPILILPYRYYDERQNNSETEWQEQDGQAYFLPQSLTIDAVVTPERRHRGIFDVALYKADLKISGSFAAPDPAALGIEPANIFWDRARLALGVTDLRGSGGAPQVTWNGKEIPLQPGTESDLLPSGAHAPVPLGAAGATAPLAFSVSLKIAGSRALAFTPTGKDTRVTLNSDWPDPSFQGAYLPQAHTVSAEGFTAAWEVSYLGRGYPQAWTTASLESKKVRQHFAKDHFGATLVSPVDFYLKTERSVKHGTLLIVLVMAAVFLFEVTARRRIHPLQYALVGFALCLFYLLLLSLAELIGFAAAYALACLLAAGLITFYIARILASRLRAAAIALLLAAIYVYLYIVLQLEELALVSGAFGLFFGLAAVMYATRNLDWYSLKKGSDVAAPKTGDSLA